MSSGAVVFGGVALVGVVVFTVSVWACWRNIRAVQDARSRAPFDGVDLTGFDVPRLRPPRRWPRFEDVKDAQEAAAYAYLADGWAIMCALFGEMLMVVGGAALGWAIPLYGGWLGSSMTTVLVLAAFFGGVLRLAGLRRWEPISDRYRERYEALAARPLPAPRRGGFLGALLRRRQPDA